MEQMTGTPPYRFEVIDHAHSRIVEFQRKGFFGGWRNKKPRNARWMSCQADETDHGTDVTVRCSKGSAPLSRALQLIELLTKGMRDRRTLYRDRPIPPGPVSLVASWAGTGYALYSEPTWDAPRGQSVRTATEIQALPGGTDTFIKVRTSTGIEGYIERDQLVVAPEIATRTAQELTAREYV